MTIRQRGKYKNEAPYLISALRRGKVHAPPLKDERMKTKTRERLLRFRKRLVNRVAILPTLLTLGNLLSGFGAIVFASRGQLELAAWMIFLAMLFDALDGKVARLTKAATNFGGELDSLCDVVSFGVAPGFIALTLMSTPQPVIPSKFLWLVCAVYAACAALRLARFNVENSPEDASHQSFHGLPSPAAAGVVASAILYYLSLLEGEAPSSAHLLPRCLPYLVLLAGLMMVSRVPYAHVVNRIFRGRRPFTTLIEVVLIGLLIAFRPEPTLFFGLLAYFCMGPARLGYALLHPKPEPAPEAPPKPENKPETP